MPLISVKIIRPRKERTCGSCHKPLEKGVECFRMYGNAMEGDPKYTIYVHPSCVVWKHPKVLSAKNKLEVDDACT